MASCLDNTILVSDYFTVIEMGSRFGANGPVSQSSGIDISRLGCFGWSMISGVHVQPVIIPLHRALVGASFFLINLVALRSMFSLPSETSGHTLTVMARRCFAVSTLLAPDAVHPLCQNTCRIFSEDTNLHGVLRSIEAGSGRCN